HTAQDLCRGWGLRLPAAEELQRLGDRHREHLADITPGEFVFQHAGLEPFALALFAQGRYLGHHRQVRVDNAVAVAVWAGARGVGTEQRRPDAVRLGERSPNWVEKPRVGGRVAPPRAADRRLVNRDHAGPLRDGALDQRAFTRTGDSSHHAEHTERDVHVHVAQVVPSRVADLEPNGRLASVRLEPGPVAEVPTGERVTGSQAVDRIREAQSAALCTRAGAEVDDMVSNRDHLRLVLHHEYGVALVPQLHQQPVHPLDVVWMQAY